MLLSIETRRKGPRVFAVFDPGVRAGRVDCGKLVCACDTAKRTGLSHIRKRDLQIEILRDRAINERVKYGITEFSPPSREIGRRRRHAYLIALGPGVRHRELGGPIVRADGAPLDADHKHDGQPAAESFHDGTGVSMKTSSCCPT